MTPTADAEDPNRRGAMLRDLKRFNEALESFEEALRIDPQFVEAHFNRGVALYFLKRHDEALESYARALALKPGLAEAHYNRGLALFDLQRFDEALAAYEQALAVRPAYAEAHLNRGLVLTRLGRYEEALASCERSLELKPDLVEAYIDRGNVLRHLGRTAEALVSCDRALQMRPDSAEAYLNRGAALYDRAQPWAAVDSYDRALAVRPNFVVAHQNRAYARLLAGDFSGGWTDHEWRWSNDADPLAAERRPFAEPLWLGEHSLVGKRILLYAEQGFGDTLQFCRYVRWVADLGARVILEAPEPLARLLESLAGVTQIITRDGARPACDYRCPLMSLPLAFRTTLGTIPVQVPYLRAEPAKVRQWGERLGERRAIRVGLVWSGGFRPHQPSLWSVNARRNVPLAKLAVLRHPGVEFHSLQKGQPAESELAGVIASGWAGPEIIDWAHALEDFSDTAALAENLDLIIAVDTATVHLAGALGRPVWLLNRFDSCWRWLLERTDSPWYPTLRIYRQSRPGEWEDVLERVRADLVALLA